MSYVNSKFHVENLAKDMRRKDNIIDQLLLDLQKLLVICRLKTIKGLLPQNIASIPLSVLKTTSQTQNLAIQKLEAPSQKKKVHIDHQLKEVCNQHHHNKYMFYKFPIQEKNVYSSNVGNRN